MQNQRTAPLCFLLVALAASVRGAVPAESQQMLLRENWSIQSSAEVHASGAAISTVGFDDEVLPVLWQDNYFPLLPRETRQVTATYSTQDLRGSEPVADVEGWNVKQRQLQR